MDGTEYDIVILGTGITESVLSGLLSVEKNKILNLDSNSFYGDSGASLNITKLWKKFRPNEECPKELGHNRDWNIDLAPKFVLAKGKLVKMIIKTDVSLYLNWKCVDGIYIYQWSEGGWFKNKGAKIIKVPSNDKEALSSSLISMTEKLACKSFFVYVQNFEPEKKETWKKYNLENMTFQ